jgi:hypothetical protein
LGPAVVERVGEGRRRAAAGVWFKPMRGAVSRAQNPYFALWRARRGQNRPF